MATKKIISCKVYKQLFFRKLVQKSPCFEEKNSQKSSCLDHEFLEVDRTKWDPKNSYFAGLPLARFGSFLLWMITHPPTDKIGAEKKKTLTTTRPTVEEKLNPKYYNTWSLYRCTRL
jgi:hypothetical protein